MPPGDSHENGFIGLNGLFLAVSGGAVGLIITLVLASYAYTWAESNKLVNEGSQWRKEHQQVLDKKFEEVKQNQERLADKLEQSNDKMRDLLQQVLEEQRRYNERIGHSNNPQRSR